MTRTYNTTYAMALRVLATVFCLLVLRVATPEEDSIAAAGQSEPTLSAIVKYSTEQLKRKKWMEGVEYLVELPYFHKDGYLLVSEYRGRSPEWDEIGRYTSLSGKELSFVGRRGEPIDISGLPQSTYVVEESSDFLFEELDYLEIGLTEDEWETQLYGYFTSIPDTRNRMSAALEEKLITVSKKLDKYFKTREGLEPFVRRGYDAFILGRFSAQKTERGYKIMANASMAIAVDVIAVRKE